MEIFVYVGNEHRGGVGGSSMQFPRESLMQNPMLDLYYEITIEDKPGAI